jgi:transposase-like protein
MFCPNCGNEQIKVYGLDALGSMYMCPICKMKFSTRVYREGNVVIKKDKKE